MELRRVKLIFKFIILVSACNFFLVHSSISLSNFFGKNGEEKFMELEKRNLEKFSAVFNAIADLELRLADLETGNAKHSAMPITHSGSGMEKTRSSQSHLINVDEHYSKLVTEPFEIPKNFLEKHDKVITPHEFKYLIEPKYDERCSNMSLIRSQLSVVLVHSEAGHFQHRATIRQTWATVGQRISKVVFLLGNPHNRTTQQKIGEESEKFGDLLQEDFHESYRNITLKAVMGMKYITTKCPTFTYICKSDDDMFVNIQTIQDLLASPATPDRDLLLCRVSTKAKVEREGKYEVSTSIYKKQFWPQFCFGGFWIGSTDVITRLYNASLHTPQLHLDDVYMTGLLREKLGLKLHKFKPNALFCHARGSWRRMEELWKIRDSKYFESDNSEDLHPDMIPLCGPLRPRRFD